MTYPLTHPLSFFCIAGQYFVQLNNLPVEFNFANYLNRLFLKYLAGMCLIYMPLSPIPTALSPLPTFLSPPPPPLCFPSPSPIRIGRSKSLELVHIGNIGMY